MHAVALFRESRRFRTAAICLFFLGTLAASLAPYQALIAINHFGFSDPAYAAIMVIGATLSAVIAVYIGIATDQSWSRRRTALLTAFIASAGLALVWITGSPRAYLFSALLTTPIGFSIMGQMFAIARLAASDRPVAVRDGAMATIRAGFALPFIVILPLWSVAFRNDVSLIQIFAATALAGFAIFLTVALLMPADGAEGGTETRSGLSFRAALGELINPRVSLRLGLLAALVAANSIYMSTMGLVFDSVHPEGVSRTAWFAGLIAGAEVPFMLAIPLLTARFTKSTILLMAALIYALFLLTFPWLAAGPWVWALVVLAAAGAAVLLTIPIAYFQDLLSDRPGTSSSLQAVQMVASQILAGGIFWLGTTIGTYGTVMTIGAGVSVLAGVALWLADHRTRQSA